MRETTTLFGHQINPANEALLGFNASLDECKAAAIEMIGDLNEHDPDTEIGAIAVYRCEVTLPDRDTIIRVLNEELSLLEACVVSRELVDTVGG